MKNSEAKTLINNFIENTEDTRENRAIYFDKYNKNKANRFFDFVSLILFKQKG